MNVNNTNDDCYGAGPVPGVLASGDLASGDTLTSPKTGSARFTGGTVCWIGTLMFRVALVAAILLGFVGSRASVSELVTGEIIETVEVVVSFHGRHHESFSFCESDREFSRRRCVRHGGRNTNVVRCCCRCLSNTFENRHLSTGHRRPDNSIAPLLI